LTRPALEMPSHILLTELCLVRGVRGFKCDAEMLVRDELL
jgi:hypothetical protein